MFGCADDNGQIIAESLKSGLTLRLVMVVSPSFLIGNVMYAVVETGSKQYRVAPGDTIEVESLSAEEGKEVTLDRVLFVANEGKFSVGGPTVDKATVVADVVKHTRGPKLIAFKMKRRKGYHRTVGHRQELTVLKIKEVKV